jgi:hypothetical protein
MGTKVQKSESQWRVQVKVTESRQTWDEDQYDKSRSGWTDGLFEPVTLTVSADDKDAAIVKAITHLSSEMTRSDDAPAE